MLLKRSTAVGCLCALMISGACTANQDSKPKKQESARDQAAESKQAAADDMVEIKVRMPDGRIVIRKERRNPSRLSSDQPLPQEGAPEAFSKKTSSGKVNNLKNGVKGGSNGSSDSALSVASGSSSGGGKGAHSGGSGGGGRNQDSTGSGDDGGNDPSTGSGSGGGIIPVQPDDDYTVRIYAWENSGPAFEHVFRTYIADPRSKTPQRLADLIAAQVRREEPEKIAIRFWKEFDPAITNPFDMSDPRELFNSGGYSAGLEEYWNEFAQALASLNVKPDYLIFDMEEGVGFWHIPEEVRHTYFETVLHPAWPLRSRLPASMRGITADQLMDYHNAMGAAALDDYNQFASEFRAQMLNRVFEGAFQAAYGEMIPISNYKDMNTSFETFGPSGRPNDHATMGGISAPVAYLEYRPHINERYRYTHKEQRWNRLIDAINRVRSSATAGLVTPWVSAPGFKQFGEDKWADLDELDHEYRLFDVFMNHMLAMGVDTFILWNPGPRFNPHSDVSDAYVDQWLAEHPVAAGPQLRNLPEIPLDADRIETNGVVTTYAEYLEFMNSR